MKGRDIEHLSFERRITEAMMNIIPGRTISGRDIEEKLRYGRVRVIGVVEGQIYTKSLVYDVADREDLSHHSLNIIAVADRYSRGNISVGYIRGFNIEHGAFAQSVSHDAHNIVAVGRVPGDIAEVINRVFEMSGGIAVKSDTIYSLPLPYAGLMSDRRLEDVAENLKNIKEKIHALGCDLDNPVLTLSFMCLSVIPELKITDRGLVENFRFVDLQVDDNGV